MDTQLGLWTHTLAGLTVTGQRSGDGLIAGGAGVVIASFNQHFKKIYMLKCKGTAKPNYFYKLKKESEVRYN